MNVYDFDKTIYNGDSAIDFYLYSLRKKPAIIRYIPHQVVGFLSYACKRIDKTKLKAYFFSFLQGVDVCSLAEDFWKSNDKKIYKWYLDQQKKDDVIISASPEFLLQPICKKLNVKFLIASKVDYKTGAFLSDNCRGEEKVTRFLECFKQNQIDSFYSDSKSDLPMAKLAKQSYFVSNGEIFEWK